MFQWDKIKCFSIYFAKREQRLHKFYDQNWREDKPKKINEMLEEIPMNYGEIVVFHEEYKQFIKEILVLRKEYIFDKIIK